MIVELVGLAVLAPVVVEGVKWAARLKFRREFPDWVYRIVDSPGRYTALAIKDAQAKARQLLAEHEAKHTKCRCYLDQRTFDDPWSHLGWRETPMVKAAYYGHFGLAVPRDPV